MRFLFLSIKSHKPFIHAPRHTRHLRCPLPFYSQLTKSTRASSSNRRAAEAPPHHEQAAQRPRTSSPNAQQSAQQNVASTSMPQPNLPAPLSLQVATATASDIAAAAAAAAAQMVQDATSSSQQQPNAPAPLSAQAAATASNVAAAAAVQSTQFSPDAEQLLGTLLSPQGVDLSSPAGRELALPQLREGLDRVADLLDVRLSCGPRQPHKDVPGLVVQGVVGLGHCVVAPCRYAFDLSMKDVMIRSDACFELLSAQIRMHHIHKCTLHACSCVQEGC